MQEEDRTDMTAEQQVEQPGQAEPGQTEASSAVEPQQEESRTGRIVRRSLRWIAGLAFVFALGVLVVFFARVRPQSDQIRSLQRQLDESQQELSTAQARVEDLEPLQDENQRLVDRLAETEHHLELLEVLVDVTSAQLDIARDQPEAASAALEETDAKLEALLEGLEGQNAETVRGMRNRLELVLEGLDDDIFAAQRDLEIMTNNLVDLERQMFQQ